MTKLSLSIFNLFNNFGIINFLTKKLKTKKKKKMFSCIRNFFYPSTYLEETRDNDDIILTPKNIEPTSILIFLHGLGDTGDGYIATFNSSEKPIPESMKVILPTAPLSPVTLYNDQEMRSWFNVKNYKNEEDISKEEFQNNSKRINDIINREVKNVNGDYKKIFIGGFSQGACIALNVGLNFEKELGGIIVFSGILFPFCTNNIKEEKLDIPIYIGHGINDDIISVKLAKMSYEYLSTKGYKNITIYDFYMGHCVNPQELIDMKEFINSRLNELDDKKEIKK